LSDGGEGVNGRESGRRATKAREAGGAAGSEVVARGPGARGLAALVLAPGCEFHEVGRVLGADLAGAAAYLERREPTPEGSMIAVEQGEQWEAALRSNGGRRLLDAYRATGLLDATATVRDLERECGGDREARRAATRAFMADALAGRPTPAVLFKPLYTVTVARRPVELEPDGLVRHLGTTRHRPLEIKTLRDQAGQTPRGDLAMIRLQAGAEVLALRAGASQAGDADAEQGILPVADLVLRSRLGARPVIRSLRLARELGQLTAAIARVGREVPALLARLPDGVRFDTPETTAAALAVVPTTFSQACTRVCPLAGTCFRTAADRGDIVALGDDAAEFWDGLSRPSVQALLVGSMRPDTPERRRVLEAALATRQLLGLPAVPPVALPGNGEVRRAG
jgi:hypothetical protein